MVSCSSRAVVSWVRACWWLVSRSRARVSGYRQQSGYFLVDQPLGALGIAARSAEPRMAGGRVAVADRADLVAEAVVADHLGGQGGGGHQVVRDAGGGLREDQPLGGAAR
jgi:hypothetical protein